MSDEKAFVFVLFGIVLAALLLIGGLGFIFSRGEGSLTKNYENCVKYHLIESGDKCRSALDADLEILKAAPKKN